MKTFKLPCQACGGILDAPDNAVYVECPFCNQLNGIEMTEGQISLKIRDEVNVLSLGVRLPLWEKELIELQTAHNGLYQDYLVKKAREEFLKAERIKGQQRMVKALFIAMAGVVILLYRETVVDFLYSSTSLSWSECEGLPTPCAGVLLFLALMVGLAGFFGYRVKDMIEVVTKARVIKQEKCYARQNEIEKLEAIIKDARERVMNL
jgi:hypothetical protein